jgi:glutathione S-transferase
MPLLVLGSKNYSSWSLRPWLFLRKVGFDFTARVIPFDAPDYQQQIAQVSPSGKVPLLLLGEDGGSGGWLFGDFSIADAMFAPVLFRFQTYGADLSPEARAYYDHALADPDVRAWQQAAAQETHVLPLVDAIGKQGSRE